MQKKNKFAIFIKPFASTEIGTFDFTEEQKKEVEKLAKDWRVTKEANDLKERKYFVADDEALSNDAKYYIKNKILYSAK